MRTRSGWTLLEMMLSLALTTLLLSGIYGAMHVFYRGITTTRASVERDQLARTVLRRVSDDLRSAVRYMPADTSGLSGAASGGLADAAAALGATTGNSGSSGSSTGSSSTGSTGSGSTGSSSSSGSSTSSDTSTETTDTATPPPIPGVYGSANFLQIDICRLPRPDEIAANASRGTPTSEVRTVTYGMGQGTDQNGFPALIRTEQSRAAALYGSTTGSSVDPNSTNTQVLAAEVASVEFMYFDGTEWLPDWDSTAMGSVPLAIDVRVVLRTPDQQAGTDNTQVAATAADAVASDPSSVFRLVVHLPAALTPAAASSTPTTEDPAAAAAAAASAATTPASPTSGSGSSSSGTGSSSGGSGSSGGGSKGGGGSGGGTKGGGGGGGGPGTGGTGGAGTGGAGTGGTGTGGTGSTGGGTTTPPPTPPAAPTDPTMMP
jgi:type II secretory pathway pseudopilin PulG